MGVVRVTKLALAIGLGAVVAACAPAAVVEVPGPHPIADPTPEMLTLGRQVYTGPGLCSVCHGQNARGGAIAPNLVDGDWIWLDPDSPSFHHELVDIIRNGIPEPRRFSSPMPAMGGGNLSEEQIHAVAAYILSL
jgi:mono/diheme cytochrome c family protein